MKKIILLLLLAIIVKTANAQINWALYSQSYPNGTTDKPANIGLITAELETNNSFWVTNNSNALIAALATDPKFQSTRPKEFTALTTFDTTKAEFFLHGVNKSNAGQYEFRVMVNLDSVMVPWSNITRFTESDVIAMSGMPQMAYLGGYRTRVGNKIILDVRKKGAEKILATSVVAWQAIRPIISDIYTADELNIFLKRLSHPWTYRRSAEEIHKWEKRYSEDELDKATGLPKKLFLGSMYNSLVFYLAADIHHKDQIEYALIKNNEMVIGWRQNDLDNNVVWLKNLTPGDYLLMIKYPVQPDHVTTYPFYIKTPWYQSTLFKVVAGILTCAFFGFILFLVLHIKQKREAQRELEKKTKLQLELKAIYAQLNPHFIFNALSSIQGLINKQDIKGANSYLSDFARLMRDSLNNSNKDQTSLHQEVLTLETYLKLEQLRFGFKYEVNIDKHINAFETELPTLLLQPLVENAIKHGVSGLQEKGVVNITFVKKNNDMVATIADNGAGFIGNSNTAGFGLKLTRDRIKLLNQVLKGQSISFETVANTPTGAKIVLTFKNWFL